MAKKLVDISDPAERAARIEQSRRGARSMHAKHDPKKSTEAARNALMARFERQVDPHGGLLPETRRMLAEDAKSAYFRELAMRRWHKQPEPQAKSA